MVSIRVQQPDEIHKKAGAEIRTRVGGTTIP
jgi:hypothetical protein